ncbi:helix-turn-helix transcriptional regulator [Spirosoma sp. KCTC 42546]|uniref:helix-turn-helix domain-containing protein n=1 Tax=Spirosoma sp. KCTC 42546 TaxID=2520506 RepID=UPI00115A0EA0|nr:helix-turn-helix transcriptional regulator [Spirosoma sp. KCTC 42546]QDK82640.1 helix-turn-helix transcriptional regulator [Spirosoma sp. KCTC 42546]
MNTLMTIGEKIRSLRAIKGYSQETMADLIGISSIAYSNIERNKTDISHSRLEQIAKVLGMDLISLLSHGEQIANIFSNCTNNNVVGTGNIVYSEQELRHQLEKANLTIALLTAEKNKAEMEANYWKEKYTHEQKL